MEKHANSSEEAQELFEHYGGLHDCTITKLVQDYANMCVQIYLDDLYCGLDGMNSCPGVLILEKIDHIFFRVPYVGGEVRIDGIEVDHKKKCIAVRLYLSTTEWTDSDEFKHVDASVTCRSITVEHSCCSSTGITRHSST